MTPSRPWNPGEFYSGPRQKLPQRLTREDIKPKSDWFFCTLKGGRLSDRQMQAMMNRRGRKAGIEIRCHPHLLRHTYATELLEDGYSIIEVQKLLGHAQLSTTAIYLHVADENLRRRLVARTE
jgi:site-specific recombinase XerD